MKKLLLISSVLLLSEITFGQDTLTISKSKVVEMALANNHQAKIADKYAEMALADYHQSNSLYLPTISASYTAITTNNPLMAFGSKLNQEILTQNDFNPDLLNKPERVNNYATEILIIQPLLNLDGIYGRSAANIQKQAYQLKAQRTKEYLELEVNKHYMQLQLAYEGIEVLNKARTTSEEVLRMIQDYYDQGLILKSDLLDVEVHLGEVQNQHQYAISHVKNASDQLAIALGEIPGGIIYKPADRSPTTIEKSTFQAELPAMRKDILAMRMSVEGYENMAKSSKMNLLPRINAFGSYQLYDSEFMGFSGSGYLIGAKLSWNIFDGYSSISKSTKAKLTAQKAELESQQYASQQIAELNKTNRMLSDALNKVQLTELAFTQSKEAYQIRKDRFEQGLETTSELLRSETQSYQKELEYRQAIFEYNFTKEYLHFLTRQ